MTDADNAQQPENQPSIQVVAQYVHDFSFENPNAPESLVSGWPAPETGVQIHLRHRHLKDDMHETALVLRIEAKNKEQDKTAFIIELTYCGLVSLKNIPEESIKAVMMVEVPKLMFPFVREAVADAVQKGGYPPLYLQPISFEAIYTNEMKRLEEESKGKQEAGA